MDSINNFQLYLEEGKRYFEQGDYSSALNQYNKVLKQDFQNKQALFEAGKTYYVLENYPIAIKFLKETIELDACNEHAHMLLAKVYKIMGLYDDSIGELLQLKKLEFNNEEIKNELKNVYKDKYCGLPGIEEFIDKYDTVVRNYETRLKANPGNEKLLSHLAQLYNFRGNYELTKKIVPQALKIIPDDSIFFRNKLMNELEIALGKTILSSKMRSLAVTLSNKCNLSCIMCLTSKIKWNIPKKVVKEIFSLFPYLERVMWQGGEVFALDYFEDILSEAFKYPNLKQRIVTNGLLITEKIVEKLVKNNVEITFSIDGVTKNTYEYIRRGGDFDVLLRNLRLILELREKYNSDTVLDMNVAVMKSNYRQLEEFIDFAKDYGFDFVCIMPIHIHLKTLEDIFTNQDMEALSFITKVRTKIEEKAKKYRIRLENRLPTVGTPIGHYGTVVADLQVGNDGFKDPSLRSARPGILQRKNDNKSLKDKNKLLCHIPWQQLYIDYDGTVRPDCLCSIEHSAGNLLETPSLEEIWNNEVMQEYRRKIVNSNYSGFCNENCISGKIKESHLKIP